MATPLDADTVWQRVELAVGAHQIGLLRTLANDLAGKDKAAVLHLADLLADSGRARQAAKHWPDDAAHRRAIRPRVERQCLCDLLEGLQGGRLQRLCVR